MNALLLPFAVLPLATANSVEPAHHAANTAEARTVELDTNSLAKLEMKPVEISLPDGTTKTVYRGMLRVPILRSKPTSKEIGVDVWRFPAAEGVPEDRLPVFQLHGGPGWGGYTPRNIDWDNDVAPWTAHGDLVVVGQRGIGQSEPNTSCAEFPMQVERDASPEEIARVIHEQCTACRKHWEAQGYDLTGFNVIEAAGDVNDVRRLLGYEQIVVLGGSFGSHWGMTVLRYHPEIVARALLHGMEGPDHTYDSPSGLLGAMERIAAQAEASPAFEGRIPEEGLIDALRFVIESIEEEPFEMELGDQLIPITAEALRDVAMGYENRVNSRRSVGGWPADIMRLYEGDFEGLARAIQSDQDSGNLPTASFFQLDCGSGITATRLAKLKSDPAIEIVGDKSLFYETACAAWDADLGDEFRGDFKTKIPTVIVHGNWDVSTPYDNALELLPCFEQLHFVPVDGGTHGALGEAMRFDSEFREAVMAFLYEGKDQDIPAGVKLPPIEWRTSW